MKKAKSILDQIINFVLVFITSVMCVVVFWQVFTRFILGAPSTWTEEAAKYMMIWIAFLAGSMGLKTGTHIGLTALEDKLHSPTAKLVLKIIICALCVVVGAIIFYYGIIFTKAGAMKTGSAVNIRMSYIYVIIPISGVLTILNSIENVVGLIKSHNVQERGDVEK